ncbi:hypothetical protein T4B_8749 [Trichinella pseudospiralis]|uniref:Uncharacterized protein n=1 Tax=Trichinella pseudospiralis TaxID=6337 RepID=A0A0V1IFL4_TRIPS|nr:hypothetical protein T4B_8749 [Trichinella pseudospiralis]
MSNGGAAVSQLVSQVAFLLTSSISKFSPRPLQLKRHCEPWRSFLLKIIVNSNEKNQLNYRKMNSLLHLWFDGLSLNKQLLVQLKICAARLMGRRRILNTIALFIFNF